MATDSRAQTGFYCSTSGSYFVDKESLTEHYKSDFHRYNLKRKVAGLPPVSLEWFEARKAQLSQASATEQNRVWLDPLTKKKFASENTYEAFVRSKKYLDLVKKSGEPAPEPVIIIKKQAAAPGDQHIAVQRPEKEAGFTMKPASSASISFATKKAEMEQQQERHNNQQLEQAAAAAAAGSVKEVEGERVEEENDDGWETASDDEAGEWEEWDLCRSLLDNHMSPSLEANLEYMYKKFGFYFPDAQYLKDPEGLLRYLGAKLEYGRVPLYTPGDESEARQFRSLHAVQRHMVDTNQCKMVYEENEEEYADFYDYQEGEGEDEDNQLVAAGTLQPAAVTSGFELILPGTGKGGSTGGKILGTRDFSRYYRQKHKPSDTRTSVAVNTVLAQYRRLAISTKEENGTSVEQKQVKKTEHLAARSMIRLYMRSNINRNLPKNVPY